jgi:hypothetical protein
MTQRPGRPRPLNVDDLDLLPDDGHRYEFVDGTGTVDQPFPVTFRPADLLH